jgi:phosphohistidine phosphatase
VPDHVLVSDALRTRETWQLADPGAAPAAFHGHVYEATADDLRQLIADAPEDAEVVAVVGHNPAVERLAWELDNDQRGMPPCAVVVFSVGDWGLGDATLQHHAVPRG